MEQPTANGMSQPTVNGIAQPTLNFTEQPTLNGMEQPIPPPSTGPLPFYTVIVGGVRFTLSRDNLCKESGYFYRLLEDPTNMRIPNIYIDRSPSIFADIVGYMREGVCPIYWEPRTGHILSRYGELTGLANHLDMPYLERWLDQRRYLHAVRIETRVNAYNQPLDGRISPRTLPADTETVLASMSSHVISLRQFICPLHQAHHVSPALCDAACNQAQNGREDAYQDIACLVWASSEQRVVEDFSVLLEAREWRIAERGA